MKSLFVVSAASIMVVFFSAMAHAATLTWDGDTDLSLSTGTNWVGDVAPVAGDDLVFDADAVDFTDVTLDNDYPADTSFNSISVTTVGYAETPILDGNSMELVAGVTAQAPFVIATDVTLTASQTFMAESGTISINGSLDLGANTLSADGFVRLNGVVSGSGTIDSVSGAYIRLYADNTFTGDIVSQAGDQFAFCSPGSMGAGTGHTFVDGSRTYFSIPATGTVDYTADFAIGGAGSGTETYDSAIQFSPTCSLATGGGGGGGGGDFDPQPLLTSGDITFSGTVALTDDTSIHASPFTFSTSTITFEDVVGDFDLLQRGDMASVVSVNGANLPAVDPAETTYDDNQPGFLVYVVPNNTVTVTGERGDVAVYDRGTLKGTGTVDEIVVFEGGTLAPGTSPGCLNSSDLTLGGTFEIELAGTTVCTEYDQQRVTGTVDLTGSTLDLVLLDDFEPSDEDRFVILTNDGTDVIVGTFTGIDEGDVVTVDGFNFVITYAGGTGNDIILTATDDAAATVVGAPDTGFFLFSVAQPVMFAAAGAAAFAVLLLNRSSVVFSARR